MYCLSCGAENPDGSNFCLKCGTNLVGQASIHRVPPSTDIRYAYHTVEVEGDRSYMWGFRPPPAARVDASRAAMIEAGWEYVSQETKGQPMVTKVITSLLFRRVAGSSNVPAPLSVVTGSFGCCLLPALTVPAVLGFLALIVLSRWW
ncbi:MAG: zinc ribbon domain-containing protein [Chloroflexi bacterium]|nr:zinc ribbon domain-containing protein [Chloroflexota bacterium]